MRIILAMVLSVDGKTTKGDQSNQSWASLEDQKHLSRLIAQNNLILMGRKTYELAKSHIRVSEGKLRVVLTRNPEKFSVDFIKGQLEFIKGSVREVVGNLEDRGYKQALLLSGENLNKEFFEDNLIEEIYLTVEPKIFGSGKGVVAGNLDIQLRLIEIERLNEQGTILLKYKVVK